MTRVGSQRQKKKKNPTPCSLGINDSEKHDTCTANIFNHERRVVRLSN